MNRRVLAELAFVLAFSIHGWAQGDVTVIRVGAFPNITHAQPMVGKANGWFEKVLGSSVKIQWTSFNAGPSAIEALFAAAGRWEFLALPGRDETSPYCRRKPTQSQP